MSELITNGKANTPSAIRVALILASFPSETASAFKYFLLLLNRLQHVFEFEFHEPPNNDPFIRYIQSKKRLNADRTRDQLIPFSARLKEAFNQRIHHFDLSETYVSQIIIISLATLTNYHYLIRRENVTLLTLGEWDRSMAPPSAAEFLQVAILRAAYSALEGEVWNSIHLGTRACMFDFTVNLDETRLMTLVGLGVCSECERALIADGHPKAPNEIRRILERSWLGDRNTPGSPASIMSQFGYDLFLTKGFTTTFRERVKQSLQEDAVKELIKLFFAILLAGLLLWLGITRS
jgi:hypothetical protein